MEHTIDAFLLLILLVLSKQITNGYLIQSWDDECITKYFYKGNPPVYFNLQQPSPINNDEDFICQAVNRTSYFMTRYSKFYKIPIYSAYTINTFDRLFDTRVSTWKMERELSKLSQATNLNYYRSGFQKGHLNPKSYNRYSIASIRATFTLTNAAPMLQTSNNRWSWYAERPLWDKMRNECSFTKALRYIITGVVPSELWTNPVSRRNRNVDIFYGSVNIPVYMWTAACCDTSQVQPRTNGWSIGFLINTQSGMVETHTIPNLERILKGLLPSRLDIQLFQYYLDDTKEPPFLGCNF